MRNEDNPFAFAFMVVVLTVGMFASIILKSCETIIKSFKTKG